MRSKTGLPSGLQGKRSRSDSLPWCCGKTNPLPRDPEFLFVSVWLHSAYRFNRNRLEGRLMQSYLLVNWASRLATCRWLPPEASATLALRINSYHPKPLQVTSIVVNFFRFRSKFNQGGGGGTGPAQRPLGLRTRQRPCQGIVADFDVLRERGPRHQIRCTSFQLFPRKGRGFHGYTAAARRQRIPGPPSAVGFRIIPVQTARARGQGGGPESWISDAYLTRER